MKTGHPGTLAVRRWRWALRRAREIRRWEGMRGLAYRAVAVLGYRSAGWFVRPLDASVEAARARVPAEVSRLSERDVDAYVAFRRGATPRQFLDRLEVGNVCFAARCEGRLVSVTWVAVDRARVAFLARELTLEAGEIYLFDAFTLPEHRGERLQALLTARIVSHFRALGYRQAVSLIGPENRPNIASRERLGFRRTGTMGCIRLGRLRWDFFRGRRGYPIQAEEGNEPPTPRQR